ncbi:malonate decarboxylase subunit epsilon [Oxalobacter sp. OttesenSCG-928-P03]|nr:malonate decarboxylase subunit epsilon [Oxalobacter sp. OttesenSCG-928-P03]
MKIMFTFPGQGAQRPGMMHSLPQKNSVLKEACDILQVAPASLDSAEALKKTREVQLCLLISGAAWSSELIRNRIIPDFVSGLSIGAFPAAVCSGALDFSDAVRLVALRGELMENTCPSGYGLTALSGLTLKQVEMLVDNRETWIANINAERQIVIAGSNEGMGRVAEKAIENGAQKAQRLAVSVPSHCALLSEPAEKLAAAFSGIRLRRPRIAYLSGSTGRVLWDPKRIAEDLAFNMARTVLWHDAMTAAYEREVRLAIEMPPGAALTMLTRQVFPSGEAISLEQGGTDLAWHLAKKTRLAA